MSKFKYDKFVTNNIPGCYLNNSNKVKQAAETILPKNIPIHRIYLAGICFKNEILLEWHITITIEKHPATIRLPVYIPLDEALAKQQIKKHTEAALQPDLQIIQYAPEDYFLINYKYPCQLVLEKDGSYTIKRFTILPSQKIVQELLTSILQCELVTATLVVTTFHTLYDKGMHDICWLFDLNGDPILISIDRIQTETEITIIDKYEELPIGYTFELNYQKYIVECDKENGIFLAPFSYS